MSRIGNECSVIHCLKRVAVRPLELPISCFCMPGSNGQGPGPQRWENQQKNKQFFMPCLSLQLRSSPVELTWLLTRLPSVRPNLPGSVEAVGSLPLISSHHPGRLQTLAMLPARCKTATHPVGVYLKPFCHREQIILQLVANPIAATIANNSLRPSPQKTVCDHRSAPQNTVCDHRSAPQKTVCDHRSAPQKTVCDHRDEQ